MKTSQEEITELRPKLTAAEAKLNAKPVKNWLPINTAPRDGTAILLLTDTGIVEGWYSKGEWVQTVDGPEYYGACWVCYDDAIQLEIDESDGSSDAKFWIPIPPKPPGFMTLQENTRIAQPATEQPTPEQPWRDLLPDEVIQKGDEWQDYEDYWNLVTGTIGLKYDSKHCRHRTRRPLPQPATLPALVPLEAKDVPIGSAVHHPNDQHAKWEIVEEVRANGLFRPRAQFLAFADMKKGGWLINRNDGKGFVPCSKEAESFGHEPGCPVLEQSGRQHFDFFTDEEIREFQCCDMTTTSHRWLNTVKNREDCYNTIVRDFANLLSCQENPSAIVVSIKSLQAKLAALSNNQRSNPLAETKTKGENK